MRNRILYLLAMMLLLLLMIPFAASAQEQGLDAYKKDTFINKGDTLCYRILYPENFSSDEKYPLLLFLHGAGERGNDNEAQLIHGGDLFLKDSIRKEFPAIVVFPQVPKDDYWANVEVNRNTHPFEFDFHNEAEPTTSMKLAMKLMDSLSQQKFVDNERIYVGGLSMGGMGTYEILSRKPEMFAAAFVICGAADPVVVNHYRKGFPVWIFQGEKDDIVSPHYAKMLARLINHKGGEAKLSLYPNDNHNSWDSALAEPYLLPWLFSKKLTNENEEYEK